MRKVASILPNNFLCDCVEVTNKKYKDLICFLITFAPKWSLISLQLTAVCHDTTNAMMKSDFTKCKCTYIYIYSVIQQKTLYVSCFRFSLRTTNFYFACWNFFPITAVFVLNREISFDDWNEWYDREGTRKSWWISKTGTLPRDFAQLKAPLPRKNEWGASSMNLKTARVSTYVLPGQSRARRSS